MTRTTPTKKLTAGKLNVKVYETRLVMGAEAAKDAAEQIRTLQASREGLINVIFAAAPSQNEFLQHLSIAEGIDWNRMNGFHMDEYVGLEQSSPQSFAAFLRERIFNKLPPNQVYYINGNGSYTSDECERYTRLLKENPVDIVCMGIGENTHIAFNDPHTADFNDPVLVKVVELDEASRQQQVHDGCFPNIDAVPKTAITLTVPALLNASTIFCMVPGKNKALAVYRTLHFEVKEKFPSTSLRNHPAATLYLDRESAQRI